MPIITRVLLVLLLLSLNLSHAADSLDINAASAGQLARQLPGIGPAKALRIIQWREQHGPFEHIEQLLEVKGIGPKTLEKLRAFVRIGTEAQARKTRQQQHLREEAVRLGVHRIIDGARLAAQTKLIEHAPTRPWFQRSALDIMRTH